jgi:hypothetical protein
MLPWLLIGLTSGALAPTPPPIVIGGRFGPFQFESRREIPPDVRLVIDLVLAPLEFSAELHVLPANVHLQAQLLAMSPYLSTELTMRPDDMRVRVLLDLNDVEMTAMAKALGRKKDSR